MYSTPALSIDKIWLSNFALLLVVVLVIALLLFIYLLVVKFI